MKTKAALIYLSLLSVYGLGACTQKTASNAQNSPVIIAPPVLPPSEGTATQGGGGNLVNGTLFDLVENSDAVRVSTQELLALDAVKLSLQRLFDSFPVLSRLLVVSADSKPWIFDSRPLKNVTCENSSTVDVVKEIAACQTALETRINKTKWAEMSEKQRAALIVHELFIGQVLKTNKRFYEPTFQEKSKDYKLRAESAVREIIRNIFEKEKIDEQSILEQVKKADLRFFVDELFLKDKSSQLDWLYKLSSIYDLESEKRAPFEALGTEERFVYFLNFSTKADFENYLKFLKLVIANNNLKAECLKENQHGSLRSFDNFNFISQELGWDAIHFSGVSEIKPDVASVSALPLLAAELASYPEFTTGYDEFCSVFGDDYYVLGKTPFEPLPQERIWDEIHSETKKRRVQ